MQTVKPVTDSHAIL